MRPLAIGLSATVAFAAGCVVFFDFDGYQPPGPPDAAVPDASTIPIEAGDPALGLGALPSVRTRRGETVKVPFSLRRGAVAGPVLVRATALPNGISAAEVEVASGQASGVLEVVISPRAIPGTMSAVVEATGDGRRDSNVLAITIVASELDTEIVTGGVLRLPGVLQDLTIDADGGVVCATSGVGRYDVRRIDRDGPAWKVGVLQDVSEVRIATKTPSGLAVATTSDAGVELRGYGSTGLAWSRPLANDFASATKLGEQEGALWLVAKLSGSLGPLMGIMRVEADGSVSAGDAGHISTFPADEAFFTVPVDALFTSDGIVVCSTDQRKDEPSRLGLRRFRYDGQLDPTFGDAGATLVGGDRSLECRGLASTRDRIYAVASSAVGSSDQSSVLIFATSPSGQPLPTFGDGGSMGLDGPYEAAAVAANDDHVYVAITDPKAPSAIVYAIRPTGELDYGFGDRSNSGSFPAVVAGTTEARRVTTLADGRVVFGGVLAGVPPRESFVMVIRP